MFRLKRCKIDTLSERFDEVVGGWEGRPLRRPAQGRSESREKL